jgi:hypothetical protein
MWPTINRAQQFVEISYPELVTEMITDLLKEADQNRKNSPEKTGAQQDGGGQPATRPESE